MKKLTSRSIVLIILLIFLVMLLVACDDTYTVTLNSNGGTELSAIQAKNGSKIEAPTEPTKEGYIFKGWYRESNFATEFNFYIDTITE